MVMIAGAAAVSVQYGPIQVLEDSAVLGFFFGGVWRGGGKSPKNKIIKRILCMTDAVTNQNNQGKE